MGIIAYQNISAASPVSSVVFNANINNLNSYYQIIFDSVICASATTNAYLIVQFSDDLGVTFKATSYVNNIVSAVNSGLLLGIIHDAGTSLSYVTDGGCYLNNIYSASGIASASGTANSFASAGSLISGQIISGIYNGAPLSVNAIRIKSSDSNNISGNFYIYGF